MDGLGEHEPDGVERGEAGPDAGDLAEDDAETLTRGGGLVDRLGGEGLKRQASLRSLVAQADDPRDLNLVGLAARRLRQVRAGEVRDFDRAAAVAVVERPVPVTQDETLR